eukprot:SAG22_NODE_12458_length_442_cov_0.897959_1_plen_98_part_01
MRRRCAQAGSRLDCPEAGPSMMAGAKPRVNAKQPVKPSNPEPSSEYSTLKDFEFQEKIGTGAFGTVYRVKRKVDGNVYVIKKVKILMMSRKEQESAIN